MLLAVKFYNKTFFRTAKINNEITDAVLAAKFASMQFLLEVIP
jgi:hypothetical protein